MAAILLEVLGTLITPTRQIVAIDWWHIISPEQNQREITCGKKKAEATCDMWATSCPVCVISKSICRRPSLCNGIPWGIRQLTSRIALVVRLSGSSLKSWTNQVVCAVENRHLSDEIPNTCDKDHGENYGKYHVLVYSGRDIARRDADAPIYSSRIYKQQSDQFCACYRCAKNHADAFIGVEAMITSNIYEHCGWIHATFHLPSFTWRN